MAVPNLSFKITADLAGFNAGMSQVTNTLLGVADRVRGAFQQVTSQTQTSTSTATTGISTLATRLGGLAAVYAALNSVGAMTRIADEASLATARIQGLTGSVEETRAAQGELFSLAQRLQTGYDEAVSSFSRMLPAVKELGGGVRETTALTEILLTTAKLSGASAAESAASAMQFAQALGSGKLQGDELRSILENNNTLARTLAGGLGVTIGELQRMGEEGELTAELVATTLLKSYDDIKAKASGLPATVAGAWTQISNAFTLFVTQLANSTGVFGAIAAVMTELANVIVAVAKAFFGTTSEADRLGQNQSARSFAESVGSALAQLADIIRALMSLLWNLGRLAVEVFKGVGDTLGGLSAIAVAAVKGDFAGAKAIWDEMGAKGEATAERMRLAFSDSIEQTTKAFRRQGDAYVAYTEQVAQAGVGGGDAKLKGGGGSDSGGMTDKQVAKQLDAEMDAIQKSIDAERKRFAIAQEASQIRTEMDRDRAVAAIEAEQRVSRFQLDTQQITQQQYLEAELAFEERKYEIRRQATDRALQLAKAEGRDPAEVERINAQLLQLELDFQQRKQQVQLEASSARGGALGGLLPDESTVQGALARMLDMHTTWAQKIQSIYSEISAVFTRELITRPLSEMLMRYVRETALYKMLFAQQVTGQAAASATTAATKGAEATAVVGANAAEAASGAAASQASIPYVGPALAVGAFAMIMAMVLGARSSIKSAARGYDIPSGLNPVTQLHTEEMVLPAEHANTIRELSRQGAPSAPVELRGVSAGEFFIAVRKDLVAALKGAHREFAFL